MHGAFDLAIGLCGLLIAYVYPFVEVLRGMPVDKAVCKSWGMQTVFFTGLCLGIPALGSSFSRELGYELAVNWVPDTPMLTPIFLLGWLTPLISGSIASCIRTRYLNRSPK
jgi:hypothetical protein